MKQIWIISLAAALVLSACGAAMAPQSEAVYEYMEPPAEQDMRMEMPAAAPSAFDDGSSGTGGNAAAVERMVIKNADLSIVVADPEAKMASIQKMAEDLGGFVVSSNIYQTYTDNNVKVPEGSITIRVPAEMLDEVLTQIKSDAVEVQGENVSGQDVTSDYVDLQSRLRTHEQAAEQLGLILEQKTESQEVLDVFNQLVYHREQIELIKGQMKYLEEAAALSAVTVRLIAEETLQPLEIAGWKPVGVARDALQALINFFQGFVDFLIWLVILIVPAGVLILALLWVLWRALRFVWVRLFPRRLKKVKEPKETAE